MDKSATGLVDRLYEEVAAAVKGVKFEPRYLDPEFIHLSKIGQIVEVTNEMIRSDRPDVSTKGKELLDYVYNEIADVIKEQNLKTWFFDPTFSQRSKSAQVSYSLRVLLAGSQGCW